MACSRRRASDVWYANNFRVVAPRSGIGNRVLFFVYGISACLRLLEYGLETFVALSCPAPRRLLPVLSSCALVRHPGGNRLHPYTHAVRAPLIALTLPIG